MADNRKVWCIRGKKEDWSGHDLFLKEKVVALDNPFLPDLSQIPPARELKEWAPLPLDGIQARRTKKMYGEMYKAAKNVYQPDDPMDGDGLGLIVGHLVRLANVAKQGDLVIYPPNGKENNTVYIGKIVSEYFYVNCCFQHRRRVNWRERNKGMLPDKFGLTRGFTAVRNKALAQKIKNKWKK